MIIRLLHEGGTSFSFPIAFMWITNIVLAILFLIFYFLKRNPQLLKRIKDGILFIGSFAFLFGVLGQMIGLIAALDAV